MNLITLYTLERVDLIAKNKEKAILLQNLKTICLSKDEVDQQLINAVVNLGIKEALDGHYHTAIVCRDFAKKLVVGYIQGA